MAGPTSGSFAVRLDVDLTGRRGSQVRGFNQALSEYSASRMPRLIDGIMLTKFDTISDKVGAALSLVYTTGKPIVFVGVGQTYTDIRNLNVDHCVKALTR